MLEYVVDEELFVLKIELFVVVCGGVVMVTFVPFVPCVVVMLTCAVGLGVLVFTGNDVTIGCWHRTQKMTSDFKFNRFYS